MTIDQKALQNKIDFHPFKEQKEVIDCKEREVVLCAGRRFGKSAVVAYIALITLIEREKEITKWKKTREGKRPLPAHIWIVSPTYDLSQKVFTYLVKWFVAVFPSQRAGITNRPYPQIKTASGSWVQCKSAETPQNLLGEELDLLILDEAAFIRPDIYEQYLSATLASREGRVIFISTPFGQNWFYKKFMEAKDMGSAFQYESLVSPFFKESEWERLKKQLPEQVFNQWYRATFLADAAAVFRGVDDIISEHCLEDVQTGKYYTLGVDIGKHEDFTVLTVIDKREKKVVYWDRFRKIDYNLQKQRIIALAKRYNHARVIVDATGVGQPIKDDLEREGLIVDSFVFSGKSKRELVEKLSIFIEQKHVTIPDEPVLVDELKSFAYELTDHGNVRYSAPQGMHDDAVMSLALAVWGLNPGAAPKPKNALEQIWEEDNKPKPILTRRI